ncbi:hypothetical protein BC940DRAFT_313991 [Gongronella butleri]|nr:hypothetical protein BC940DRAFT_313991 [Gongronella butleri]
MTTKGLPPATSWTHTLQNDLSPPTTAAPAMERRLSLPDLRRVEHESMQPAHHSQLPPPGKLQIDLLNIRSDVDVRHPRVRVRLGSQQYYSSRAAHAHGDWNEGFMFTISYHNQLFDTIELDLYDRRKGWRSKTKHIGKAKLKIAKLKHRNDVFLTFLPMYEYHTRRYLPAHIQLPHNFLKSHIPNFPSLPHPISGSGSSSKKVDMSAPIRDHYLHFDQHPSHRKHSMTPFIGSFLIRVRYQYQHPQDIALDHTSKPVYLPYNASRDVDSLHSGSSQPIHPRPLSLLQPHSTPPTATLSQTYLTTTHRAASTTTTTRAASLTATTIVSSTASITSMAPSSMVSASDDDDDDDTMPDDDRLSACFSMHSTGGDLQEEEKEEKAISAPSKPLSSPSSSSSSGGVGAVVPMGLAMTSTSTMAKSSNLSKSSSSSSSTESSLIGTPRSSVPAFTPVVAKPTKKASFTTNSLKRDSDDKPWPFSRQRQQQLASSIRSQFAASTSSAASMVSRTSSMRSRVSATSTGSATSSPTHPAAFGFSRCDDDRRMVLLGRSNHDEFDSVRSDRDSAISDSASIRSNNFGDKNFAFRWINESFEEVALSHPSLDRMIGMVVSPQTRILVRAVVKMMNAFGQGFKITSVQLFSSLSMLQKFYSDIPRSPPATKVTDLQFLDEAHYFLGHAIIAYGWRGISYLGDYAKYLKDVMKTRSNKHAIVRFLKIPPEDLLGYEYGLRKGAVFQPSYFVSVDRGHEAVVLGIRGTWSLYDVITDLVCEYKPWKGGLVHSGMLASAQWFFKRIVPQIFHYIHQQAKSNKAPRIKAFIITGHSLGAGTAAILTMMIADHMDELLQLANDPDFRLHCYSYAPVASVSLDISEKYKAYIDSFVCHDDLVARLSYGTASCTKELVMDALIAADGLGGIGKVNSDQKTRKQCFDIIRTRRQEIFQANEPRYPLLYVPGRVFQFRRRTAPSASSATQSKRDRRARQSPNATQQQPPQNEKHNPLSSHGPSQQKASSSAKDVDFTLHESSALLSEEMLISKTCLEDHMLVTYLKAFQTARENCMRDHATTGTKPTAAAASSSLSSLSSTTRSATVPHIRLRDPEGQVSSI